MFQPVIEQQSTVMYYKINNDVNYREALVTLASRLYQSTTSLVEVLNPKISDLDLLTLALETEVDFFITFSDSGEIAEIVSNTIFTGIKVSLGDRKAFYEYCAKHLVSSFVKIYNVFQLFKLTKILELNRTLVDLMLSYYNAGGDLQKVLSHFNIAPSDYENTNSDFDCIVKYFSTKNSVDYDDLLQAAHKTFANVSQVYHNIENSHSLIPTKPRLYPPANITDPENILFTWGRSTCNDCQNVSYSLEIHQNNEMIFNVNDFTGELIEETSYVLPVSLEYDTTYYWAVFPKSNSDIWNLNVDFESFRIDSPPADVILYQSAIHKIVPEKLKMKPGESKILTISYQNRSSVDWKSDTANAHYVELRSIDASGNPADSVLFPDNDSWINSKRVCTQNSANVASASHENAWFIFDIAIPPNISSNYLTVFFRLYNPEHGFFGEVASIFIEIDHASNEPVTTEKKVWSFQTNAESWTARNATNDGIIFNDYWIINPYTDSASKSGVVSPYPLESISSQTFDTFEVRAAVKNQFVDSIDVHFMINNSWMPPQKMVYYSGARQRLLTITNLNYQTTYYVNIYPLDHNNERTSNQPQSLIFTTPPEPVPLPEINFSSISQVVSEQCEMITLTANLSSQGNEPITLSYSIKGTASLTDHDLMADQIIFHKGETQKIITFNIIDDTLVESDETLLITMNQMENANPGEITTHTVTIKDNDTQASLLVTPFFQDIPATDGFISFNILNTGSLDLNWHVSSLSSWLSVENSSSGINQGIVLVQHDFNPGQKRIGYLTISESDSPDISQTVSITQAANTPPYISKLYNITTYENMPAQLILSISDIETSADDLLLHASTSNPGLVPDITITGKGNNRSLSIVPSMNHSGVAEITMTVSDGDLESFSHFSVTWIDNRNPTAEISYSITETTTQQVIATLIPDEDIIVINNNGLLSKTFTQNGDFTFHFIDKAGNSGNVTASVDWIILAGDINGDDKIDIKDVILMLMRLGE